MHSGKLKKFVFCLAGMFWLSFLSIGQKVYQLTIDGPINPVTADYLTEGLAKAKAANAHAVLLQLNTPGGLLKSTRVMVRAMLESEIPVLVYVAPSGAHAGSAGVFITLAAHKAAMAPGTNIGSAHPVNLQGGMDSIMGEKTTNDAAAFIRSIAEKRGRNAAWAEDAVRYSVALAETEALKKNVVDYIAEDAADFLAQAHGDTVQTAAGSIALQTANAPVETIAMTRVQRLLNYISDPNIAYILLLIGLYGLIFEFYTPGIGLPGVAGAISLILAFYAMHTLPVNIAGLALIALSVALFAGELLTPTHGVLGIGAVVALLLGSLMLIKTGPDFAWARISLGVIIPAVIASALFIAAMVGIGLRAQKRKVTTGKEGLTGDTGHALSTLNPAGTVWVQGEIWQAESKTGLIEKGEKIRVLSVNGLRLDVESVA